MAAVERVQEEPWGEGGRGEEGSLPRSVCRIWAELTGPTAELRSACPVSMPTRCIYGGRSTGAQALAGS